MSVYLGGWRLAVSEQQAVESLFIAKAIGSACLSGEGSVFSWDEEGGVLPGPGWTVFS